MSILWSQIFLPSQSRKYRVAKLLIPPLVGNVAAGRTVFLGVNFGESELGRLQQIF
jgi:hypothetical protein